MTCTFFGHSDTPLDIRDKLKATLIDLIENCSVDLFYVGDKGNFDRLVLSVLRELSAVYPIRYYVVLAYLPKEKSDYPTLFPEGIETAPKRFAIDFRNRFMVRQSDIVVAYVNRDFGGAAKFVDIARKMGKSIINLSYNNLEDVSP